MTYDPIKARLIEMLPEKFGDLEGMSQSEKVWEEATRAITLADILLAIQKATGETAHLYWINEYGEFGRDRIHLMIFWNLLINYDGQTQEVKQFIGKLLGV